MPPNPPRLRGAISPYPSSIAVSWATMYQSVEVEEQYNYYANINISISINQSDEFMDNSVPLSSRGSGGAVFVGGSGSNICIMESTMNNNSGARCGALSIADGQLHSVKFENSIFK